MKPQLIQVLEAEKIRQLTDNERCPFVLWNGSKRLIKREEFVEFIKSSIRYEEVLL